VDCRFYINKQYSDQTIINNNRSDEYSYEFDFDAVSFSYNRRSESQQQTPQPPAPPVTTSCWSFWS